MDAAPWDHVDLVLLPLTPDEPAEPVSRAEVAEHLASRRLCAGTVDGERIGVVGAAVARIAVRDRRVAAVDPDGSLHPGPRLAEVVLGLAYRVGAVVHLDDVVVDSAGRLLDDERVLAAVELSPRSRVVTAWRDDDLLLARMTAAELGEHGDAWLLDGWVVVAWDDGGAVPDVALPLPPRHHPVVQARRSGDLRSLLVRATPGADSLEVTWAPRLVRVLDVPPGSAADAELRELELTAAGDDPDDWPPGIAPEVRPFLREAQRGPGEEFLAVVARHLWVPALVAAQAEALGPAPSPTATRVGGSTAAQLAWEHVRTPAPETDAERRLRELPRRAVVVQVATSLVLAVVLAGLALTLDLVVAHVVLWAGAGFAVFNAASTVWFRRSPHSADK